MPQLKEVEQVLRPIWLALFDPAFQPPKRLLDWIQKWRIGGQEYELKLEIAKPLAWDPASHFYMRKDIPNFSDFVEGYVIKTIILAPPSVIPPDLRISNIQKIQGSAAVMGALDHLVHVKALRSKEGNHGECLSLDRSALSNGVLRALCYIPALFSEVGAKGGLAKEEECTVSELIHVLEALGVFSLKLDIGRTILIIWGNPEFTPQEFHIPDIP